MNIGFISRKKLIQRIIVTGDLITTSALHIGGGTINYTLTDSPVVKTPDDLPYIPGSSFKGIFRVTAEKICHNFGLNSCFLKDETVCLSPKKKLNDEEKEQLNNEDENKVLEFLEEKLCDICKLFGSPYLASKIFFSDLYLHNDSWAGTTEIRDGVVIDRDSEKAVSKLKYDYEVVPAGAVFKFKFIVENPSESELALIYAVLNEFEKGFVKIGGNVTRGTGDFVISNITVKSVDFNDKEQFINYIKNGEKGMKIIPKEKRNKLIEEYLKNKLGGKQDA